MPKISACLLLLVGALAAQIKPANDWLIVPGVRVGPITASTTRSDLKRLFPGAAVVEEPALDGEEGETTTVMYRDDPTRRLAINWRIVNGEKRPMSISVCSVTGKESCRWHTREGITIHSTLHQLEKMNGKGFVLMGIGWDYSGTVVSWEGGKLQRLESPGRLIVRLYPNSLDATVEEEGQISGEREFPSSHPVMQKLNPEVYALENTFP